MNFNVNNSKELDTMKRLINYGKVEESATNTGMLTPRLEFSAVAADGKTYGIIKECNKFYIKVAPKKNTEVLAEDFDYIGGFMNKKENEYPTYAMASKQFDLKMMSINEANAVKAQVTQFKEQEPSDWQINETKEMRNEINRFNQILGNVSVILNENEYKPVANNGKVPEAPASHPSEKKVNAPFTDTAVAKGDKEFETKQTDPTKAGGPFTKDGEVTDSDMQSDKKATKNTDATYFEKAEYVPEGSVADKKPSGGKVTRADESKRRTIKLTESQVLAWNQNKDYMDTSRGTEIGDTAPYDTEIEMELTEAEGVVAHNAENQNTPNNETGHEGDTAPYDTELEKNVNEGVWDDFDDPYALNDDDFEFLNRIGGDKRAARAARVANKEIDDEVFSSERDDKVAATYDNDVPFPEVDEVDNEFEGDDVEFEDTPENDLEGIIDSIVRECVSEAKLDVWGKHPAYQQAPMTLPPNVEVAPNGARDWNDKSVESEKPFGSQIGSGAPFDEKVLDVLTDAIMVKMGFSKKA